MSVNVALWFFLSIAVKFWPNSTLTPLFGNSLLINWSVVELKVQNESLAFTTENELIGDTFPWFLYHFQTSVEVKKLKVSISPA